MSSSEDEMKMRFCAILSNRQCRKADNGSQNFWGQIEKNLFLEVF